MTTWVLEPNLMPQVHERLRRQAARAGQRVVDWDDAWWSGRLPALDGPVIFHGSLQNADRIAREPSWEPGAFCNTDGFACARWYPGAAEFLVHERWRILTAAELVAGPSQVFDAIECGETAFVRPNSPLKAFSGRVVQSKGLDLAALDHGFYYDDAQILVVVAPVRRIDAEWRYVVSNGEVVAGSAYLADGRRALAADASGAPWKYAEQVAAGIRAPDPVYVLDVCEVEGELRLLELNPFSGADLYDCEMSAVVAAVSSHLDSI